MNKSTLQLLDILCFIGGFASILASIIVWYAMSGGPTSWDWSDAASCAHRAYGERFGIFIGLWAPTFFILSHRFHDQADVANEEE
jgi:hypothetical protein